MRIEQNGLTPETMANINAAFTKARILYEAVAKAALNGHEEYAAELFQKYEDACLDIRLVLQEAGLPVINRCEVKYPEGSGM